MVEVASDRARVVLERDPLRIRVLDGDGREVLATPIAPATTGTTASATAYGALAATRDRYEEIAQLIPGWDGYVAHEAPWQRALRASIAEDGGGTAAFELELDAGEVPGAAHLEVRVTGPRVELILRAPGADKTSAAFGAGPDEHFFGMGERYASVDHRGLSLYSWAEEAGLGRGEAATRARDNPFPNGPSMTYFPVPFFISTAGYAVHLQNDERSEVHFASERPDAWRMAVSADELRATIYVTADPRRALDLFTEDTGRPIVPAPWVFGPRRRVSPGAEVGGVPEWKLLRRRGVPTTGIDDAVHFLPHRSEIGREALLEAWVDELHANGFKVMAYYNPFVSADLDAARADYEEGVANGYFVRDRTGQPGHAVLLSGELQAVASVDLTNPAATAWYHGILRRALRLGYDGWMHDFGEYIGRDWVFSDGRTGARLHNPYPVLSARAAREVLQAELPDDHLFFVRAGFTGTQAVVPAVWGGDPEATFDPTQGLPASLRGGVNLALSGVPYWGSDISGFKCFTDDPRDKEVYLRWAQLGAVSPIMHDQNACVAVSGRREKWTLFSDDETVEVYARMARLHTRLLPYFLVLAREASASGLPLLRHPALTHPGEPRAWAVESAFFLGPALYAAPVVARHERVKEVWLPPGRYVDLEDYSVYSGGDVAIPAPLDKLPLLLVEGQLLPLLDPSIETLAPATEPGIVTLEHVRGKLDVIVALAPGGSAELTLVDGTALTARRSTGSLGEPSPGLQEVSAREIDGCTACFQRSTVGAIERLRISTATVAEGTSEAFGVTLTSANGPERRLRWDVLLLP